MFEIQCLLQEAAQTSPREIALIEGRRALSYDALEQQVVQMARGFSRLGLEPGSRVAVLLPNGSSLVSSLLALHRAGLVPCLLSPRLPPATVRAQARFCSCAIGLRPPPEGTERATRGMVWFDPEQIHGAGEDGPAKPLTTVRRDPPFRYPGENPAAIVFTSGSSGAPKAAVLSHRALYYSARGSNNNLRLRGRDVWLAALPLDHVGGLGILYRCLMAGATLAFPTPGESLDSDLEFLRVSHVSVVPTQLIRWLTSPAATELARKLKAVLVGGAPASEALLVRAFEAGFPLRLSYGLTEMASQVTTTPEFVSPARRFTSGRILPHRELRVGEDGQIFVRGPTLFSGYLKRGGGIHLPVDDDDWFATGDLGSLDGDGFLTVSGRMDNLFISGGENIQPEEIEFILLRLAGVGEAVVVPVRDEEFGQRPFAFLRADPMPDPASVAAHVRAHLAGFKAPVAVHPLPPAAAPGLKVSRALLRKCAADLPWNAR